MRFALRFLALAFAIWCLAAGGATAEPVRIFAAASLKTALDQALKGHEAVAVYGASGALAKQISAGAPADLFLSADPKWISFLEEESLVAGDKTALFGNELVLIAPADSAAAIDLAPGADLALMLRGGKLAMCNIETCPAGHYGKEALANLGLWDSVQASIAQAENVRGALAFVARGEAPLGIVYATDAAAEPKVRTAATFPPHSHTPIVYEVAAIKNGHEAAARDLIAFLKSPGGQATFLEQGFTRVQP